MSIIFPLHDTEPYEPGQEEYHSLMGESAHADKVLQGLFACSVY